MADAIFQTLPAERIAAMCGGEAYGDLSVRARGICNNGQTAENGDLFVALRAARDGHDFIEQARGNGARVFLVEQGCRPPTTTGEAVIAVADTYTALGKLGRALWRAHRAAVPERRTLGITGSNGKTTSKDFAGLLLRLAFPDQVLATEGNLNSHIGLPMMLAKLSVDHQFVILEMGASHPGDIAFLVSIANIDRGLVTSIAPAHLEGFGSEDDVIREKGQILGGDEPARIAIVPDSHQSLIPNDFSGEVRTFGLSDDATVRLAGYQPGTPARAELVLAPPLVEDELHLRLEIGVPGEHNALNIAGVTAALWDLLPKTSRVELVSRAAAAFRLPRGRQCWIRGLRNSWLLDDTYNANPGSVGAALRVLAQRNGHRWAILGDMLELGDDAPALHQRVGRLAADCGCDRLWAVGDMAEHLLAGARTGGVEDGSAFPNAETCASHAKEKVASGDVILVKGSRSVGLETVVAALKAQTADCDEEEGVG